MRITWDEFNEKVKKLGEIINKGNFKPDIIIAIARGGWIPARYLSDLLHVKKMGSIGIKYKDIERTELDTYSKPSIPENCEKILLIEDMLESGKSIEWANEYYSKLGYDTKTASIFIINRTTFIPNYYLEVVEEIEFPWELKNNVI